MENGHLSDNTAGNTETSLCPFGVRFREVQTAIVEQESKTTPDINLKEFQEVIDQYSITRLDFTLVALIETPRGDHRLALSQNTQTES